MQALLPRLQALTSAESAHAEGRIFSSGLLLFLLGWVLNGLTDVHALYNTDLGQVLFLVFGILSVAGLVLMTVADLDINDYLSHNPYRIIVFVLIYSVTRVVAAVLGVHKYVYVILDLC